MSNPKHHPDSASPEPSNVDELYDNSAADGKGVRWAKDENGELNRFSKPSNGQTHWNGTTAPNTVDSIKPQNISNKKVWVQIMTALIVGNTSNFAIESSIAQAYENLGQRALGYFVIHVGGNSYGVHAPEATLLACSLDAVQRRIVRRGMHSMNFGADADAMKVAEAILAVTYDEVGPDAVFFGMLPDEFRHALISSEIVWAPDGDAAFDDGGHVLQFDVDDQVRLIAFMNPLRREDVVSSLTDVWISAEEFYGCLDKWQRQFQVEWMAAVSDPSKT